MSIKSIAAILAVCCLSACVTRPIAYQTRQPLHAQGVSLGRSALLDQTSGVIKHLDAEKNVLYMQNFGGNAAAGVLFGPLGMLANGAIIESRTNSEAAALKGRLELKPRAIFSAVAAKQGYELAVASGAAQLTPYLYLVKIGEDQVSAAAAVIVELPAEGPTPAWTGKYMVQLPATYTLEQLKTFDATKLAALQATLAEGYAAIITHMQSDKPEAMALEKAITFQTPFLTPRMEFDVNAKLIADNPDLVWVRTVTGIYALRKETFIYTIDRI